MAPIPAAGDLGFLRLLIGMGVTDDLQRRRPGIENLDRLVRIATIFGDRPVERQGIGVQPRRKERLFRRTHDPAGAGGDRRSWNFSDRVPMPPLDAIFPARVDLKEGVSPREADWEPLSKRPDDA